MPRPTRTLYPGELSPWQSVDDQSAEANTLDHNAESSHATAMSSADNLRHLFSRDRAVAAERERAEMAAEQDAADRYYSSFFHRDMC